MKRGEKFGGGNELKDSERRGTMRKSYEIAKRRRKTVKKWYSVIITLHVLTSFAEDEADSEDGGESASGEEPTTPPPPAGGAAPTPPPAGGAVPPPNPIVAAVVSFSLFFKYSSIFIPGRNIYISFCFSTSRESCHHILSTPISNV